MRGAHRGVWCSKGTLSIEAVLFAAESKRPAQNGRALLCAADHAREIQGITAPHKLPDARNRAPFLPFRRATKGSRGAKEGLGESRGGKGTIWCPCPLLSPPPDGGIPAGEHRLPRPPKAATVHAHFERKPRLQRRTAVSAKCIPSADGKKDLYLSFGRRMFRMIATNAAGTIPEPPKISWIACGACARIDIFAPMP